jgi:hypothetical protein
MVYFVIIPGLITCTIFANADDSDNMIEISGNAYNSDNMDDIYCDSYETNNKKRGFSFLFFFTILITRMCLVISTILITLMADQFGSSGNITDIFWRCSLRISAGH